MFVRYNPNPGNKTVGDCTVRALSIAMGLSWDDIHADLSMVSHYLYDMPSSNAVWGEYLYLNGFRRHIIPNTCPACYTIRQFTNDYPIGTYVLATGSHVVAVIDGDYYDTWDSGSEIPIYYWRKERW
jgi:hypothetical protein